MTMPYNDGGHTGEDGVAAVTESPTRSAESSPLYVEAERRHAAELAEHYESADPADWPTYKRPGSPEYRRWVEQHAEWLRWEADVPPAWSAPMEPTDRLPSEHQARMDTDGRTGRRFIHTPSGAEYEPDRRVELAIPGHIDAAVARHGAGRHADGTEHGCPDCYRRTVRHRETSPAVLAIELDRESIRETIEARWRSHLLAGRRVAEDREIHPPATAPADSPPADHGRKTFLTLDDLADMPEPAMLVDEVLPLGAHGLITGRDGTYKTFLALDLALSIVTNSDWHGRPTEVGAYGRVLYLAGEGVRSFGKRIEAWQAAHRPLHPWERQKVLVRNGTVPLDRHSAPYAELAELAGQWTPDLIVFDTLQRSAGAADQNSASEMAVITERVAELRRLAGEHCTTVLVAHTTKGDTDTRGSSSIEDDADFVLHCKREESRLRLTVAKLKDGEDGGVITLHPRQVLDSLVLADSPDPLRAVAWTSNSAEAKVLGALRLLAPLGPQSQAALVRQAEPLVQSAVSGALARLVAEGAVHRVGPPGRGATYQLADPTTGGDEMEQR